MSDIKVDFDNNYELPIIDGDLVLVTGQEAIKQELIITFRTWLGEYFRHTTIGMDYKNIILRRGISQNIINSEIQRVLLSVTGVISIEDFEASVDSGLLSVSANIKTKDGEFPFTVEV